MRQDLRNRKVTVVGYGRSGQSAVRLLLREEAVVTVTDRRSENEISAVRETAGTGFKTYYGGHPGEAFRSAELIVVSPGVRGNDIPELQSAAARGIPVIGEVELAYGFLDCPVIAVTGSNGKSTTTVLTAEILKKAGKRVFAGGNLGLPLCEAVLDSGSSAEEGKGSWDWVVAELSSFQLETIRDFRPQIAVLLNITPNHLDRYSGLDEYGEAKWRLFENQTNSDWAIINADDPVLFKRSEGISPKRIYFGRKTRPAGGVFIESGWVVSEWKGFPGGRTKVLPEKEIRLLGSHNLENVLAAAAAGMAAGCPPESVRLAVSEFEGLEHRLEAVRRINDVLFINDSKATTVSALGRALDSFASPLILIAGGRSKGGKFDEVCALLKEKVRTVILIGEARRVLQKTWEGTTRIIPVEDLDEAVVQAASISVPGDVVLLSPACASFDMFRDFADRGNHFKRAVNRLSGTSGSIGDA